MLRSSLLRFGPSTRRAAAAGGTTTTTVRGSATMQKRDPIRMSALPPEAQESIRAMPDIPMAYPPGLKTIYNAPVTSAHMIEGKKVSTLDSAVIAPDGSIMHGRYGKIPEPYASGIPLEYLALLRPAAEGAAALRKLTAKSKVKKGTVLVYGASYANGMAFAQMADAAGHAVVAVVAGDHSSNDDMMFAVKHMLKEPSVAVPEDIALRKTNFRQIVRDIVNSDEGIVDIDPETYLKDFKELFIKQSEAYPDTRPAAVPEEEMEFKYMEKDREDWEINQSTYLQENFPPGAPPVDKAKLDAFFTTHQYEIFRQKFWNQTTACISGVDTPSFSAFHEVHKQIQSPEDPALAMKYATGGPWTFSIFNKSFPPNTDAAPGGPLLGAVICVNQELVNAAKAVNAAKSIRAKAEALKFIGGSARATFLSARSVVQQATEAGAPVYVLGGELPGFETLKVTDADVKAALTAMDIDDNGNTVVNFYVHDYRASDFPFYADFAVHRANEIMNGPRQIIVLK